MPTYALLITLAGVLMLLIYSVARWRQAELTPAPNPFEGPSADRRRLPVLQPGSCGLCARFNPEAGQAVLNQFPAFQGAAQVLSPAQIGRPRRYKAIKNEDGEIIGEEPLPHWVDPSLLVLQWSDAGRCTFDNGLVMAQSTLHNELFRCFNTTKAVASSADKEIRSASLDKHYEAYNERLEKAALDG